MSFHFPWDIFHAITNVNKQNEKESSQFLFIVQYFTVTALFFHIIHSANTANLCLYKRNMSKPQ